MNEDIFYVKRIQKNHYLRYFFTDEQKQLVVDLYEKYGSTVDIGNIFNVGHKVIAKVLKEFNIDRNGQKNRKYKLNEHYFQYIDDPNKAYILGLFFADGCNCFQKSTISISLQESDKDILEKIRNIIGSEKELEFIDYSDKHDFNYTYKNQYRLLMFSKIMCKELSDNGMISNKSLTLQFPKILDSSLYSHFIRGYFDGDGSFYTYKTNCNVTLTSTLNFCESVKNILQQILDINVGIYEASNHNNITKVLNISGYNQCQKFLQWIYKDSDLYLDRKYKKYLSVYDIDNSLSE